MKEMMIKKNNMAQQTAVDFLYEFVQMKLTHEQQMQFEGLFQQAKQKEKEQIVEAYFEGFREGRGIDNIDISDKIFYEDTNAERYYNITYQPNGNHSPKEI